MFSPFLKYLLFILLALASACTKNKTGSLPSDFSFILDVGTLKFGSANHIHITIDSKGSGQFVVYDSEGIIQYDQNNIVTYDRDQVIREGEFDLPPDEQERLWDAIHQNRFFDLTEDYRMAMGYSYAFIMIEADGRKHRIDNIGMEVPEIKALVEATDGIVPEELDLEYGEGYVP